MNTLLRRTHVVLGFCVLAVGCSDPTSSQGPPPVINSLPRQLTPSEQAIAASSNGFAFSLLRAVNATMPDSNVFISPLSASMALAMAMNGANGGTYDEMRSTLGLEPRPLADLNAGYRALIALLRGLDATVDFRIANAVWYRDTFGPSVAPTFLADTKTFFDARAAGLDFAGPEALGTINAWVKESTGGKIAKILDEISPDDMMFLMNAIYFKGAWRVPFDPRKTADATFTTHRGTLVRVPMMTRQGGFRSRSDSDGLTVELSYGGDAFVMTILLPAEGVDINAFVGDLTASRWTAATTGLAESSFDLYLPKFKLERSAEMISPLKALGMRQAFVPEGADFTRLSPSLGRQLYINAVRQKTYVDVNEEGTEAAAVTSVGVGITSLPPSIRLDRPFVFAIRERLSGSVLFIGKIVQPGKA